MFDSAECYTHRLGYTAELCRYSVAERCRHSFANCHLQVLELVLDLVVDRHHIAVDLLDKVLGYCMDMEHSCHCSVQVDKMVWENSVEHHMVVEILDNIPDKLERLAYKHCNWVLVDYNRYNHSVHPQS